MEPHYPGSGITFGLKDKIILRGYQRLAVKKLLENYYKETEGGVVVIPCGFGKTIIALCALGIIGCPFIVLAPSTEIAMQWVWQLLCNFQTNNKKINPNEIGMLCGSVVPNRKPEWKTEEQMKVGEKLQRRCMTGDKALLILSSSVAEKVQCVNWAQKQLIIGCCGMLDNGQGLLYIGADEKQNVVKVELSDAGNTSKVTINNRFSAEIQGVELELMSCFLTTTSRQNMLFSKVSTRPEDLARCKVVVASVASLSKSKSCPIRHLQIQALQNRFFLTVLDEAHHFTENVGCNTFAKSVHMVTAPRGRKWGLTATLLRQDGHVNDVVRDFGRQLHIVKYNENPDAVNMFISNIVIPSCSLWKSMTAHSSGFEFDQAADALCPVKLVTTMRMLAQSLAGGHQGIVFFGRKTVQDIYYKIFHSANIMIVRGGSVSEHDQNIDQRQVVRDRITAYDKLSDEFPTIVFATSCWETGVDLPPIEFTMFVNEVCEGRRHIVQASGRATRRNDANPRKQALACLVTTVNSRESEFVHKLVAQLHESYGRDSHRVRSDLPHATNFLLANDFPIIEKSLDFDAFKAFVNTEVQLANRRIQESAASSRASRAWKLYVTWLGQLVDASNLQQIWRLASDNISCNKRKR
jgi:superfamily II DNA or RNA helicase